MKKLAFLLLCFFSAQAQDFSFVTFDETAYATIQDFTINNPHTPYTITITGKPGLARTRNICVQKTAYLLHNLSLQNILLKCTASLFGATMLSYAFIAYFIYRVYALIAKISSWLSWNQQVHEHDMIEEAKQYLDRTLHEQILTKAAVESDATRSAALVRSIHCVSLVKEEERILRLYLRLNQLLKKHRIRFLFTYDQEKEEQLEYALSLLSTAQEIGTKRNESTV